MFFGTIQQGGAEKEVQDLVKLVTWMPWVQSQQQALSMFLKRIPMINDEFRLLGGEQVPTVYFYETKPVNLGVWKVRIQSGYFSVRLRSHRDSN